MSCYVHHRHPMYHDPEYYLLGNLHYANMHRLSDAPEYPTLSPAITFHHPLLFLYVLWRRVTSYDPWNGMGTNGTGLCDPKLSYMGACCNLYSSYLYGVPYFLLHTRSRDWVSSTTGVLRKYVDEKCFKKALY
ncbi:hypothetical protein FRC19_004418 [Serendipita sp. 401]|nr:hypothetical protein FRC19_004418 [Serendipita sp. 401]